MRDGEYAPADMETPPVSPSHDFCTSCRHAVYAITLGSIYVVMKAHAIVSEHVANDANTNAESLA